MSYVPPTVRATKLNIDTTSVRALGAVTSGTFPIATMALGDVVRECGIRQRSLVLDDSTSTSLTNFSVSVGWYGNYKQFGRITNMDTTNTQSLYRVIGSDFNQYWDNPIGGAQTLYAKVTSAGANLGKVYGVEDILASIWVKIESLG